MQTILTSPVKAIVGLGNPGASFRGTRHNIGFAVVDALASKYGGSWRTKDIMDVAEIMIGNHSIMLVKPLTFMNTSGKIMPLLAKKGIKPEEILVIHDELEMPFGKVKLKVGGGHKGHNGLRSIMELGGKDCVRLSMGIGRPATKEEVATYVLTRFGESVDEVNRMIDQAVSVIETELQHTH